MSYNNTSRQRDEGLPKIIWKHGTLEMVPPMPPFSSLAIQRKPEKPTQGRRYAKDRMPQQPGYRKCHTCRERFDKSELTQDGKSADSVWCAKCMAIRDEKKAKRAK